MNCLLQCVSYMLQVPYSTLEEEIGHDGKFIAFSGEPPFCHCGFHIQEIIPSCLRRGIALVPIERSPVSSYYNEYHRVQSHWEKFNNDPGILIGPTHAVYQINKNQYYDPKLSSVREISGITPMEKWLRIRFDYSNKF